MAECSMARRSEGSALTAAVAAFDDQLASYERLAELLLRTPLATEKQHR